LNVASCGPTHLFKACVPIQKDAFVTSRLRWRPSSRACLWRKESPVLRTPFKFAGSSPWSACRSLITPIIQAISFASLPNCIEAPEPLCSTAIVVWQPNPGDLFFASRLLSNDHAGRSSGSHQARAAARAMLKRRFASRNAPDRRSSRNGELLWTVPQISRFVPPAHADRFLRAKEKPAE